MKKQLTFKNAAAVTAAVTMTALLALSGCTSDTAGSGQTPAPVSSAAKATADANMADIMFTTMMIPHHEQAVVMSDKILAKDGIDDRVVTLSKQIKAAQGPEIETMQGWLKAWGAPAPSGMGGMDGDGMGGMDGGGMMSETDMAALDNAAGAEASRLFLTGMIEHHEGAIDMAQTEVDSGQNSDVKDLAQQIIDGQTAEIATMRKILATL